MFDPERFSDQLDPDIHHFQHCYDPLVNLICDYTSISDFNNIIRNSESNLNIVNYNIRSFSANSDSFISIFDHFDSTPDILVLTETWFKEDSLKELPHFNSFHTIRTTRRSGGVSCYVKDHLNSRQIQPLSFCREHLEICTVEVSSQRDIIYIISVYKPHCNFFDEFISELNLILKDSLLRKKKIIILGDFNINQLDPGYQTMSLNNCLQSYYFIPLISKPTRFSQIESHSASLLDQIWINKPSLSYECGILNFDLTDHLPTYCNVPFDTNNNSSTSLTKVTFRLINSVNHNNFTHALSNQNWSFLDRLDVDKAFISFINTLNSLYKQHFPIKTKYVTIKKILNPWINERISKLIKYKSYYYSLMKINIISREENKIFRNKVNSIVRNAKTSYYKTKFRSYQSDVKNTWSLINDIIYPNRKKCKNLRLTICNREISNTQEITEIFNTHFSSIAHNLLNNISHTSLNAIELVPPSPQSFFLSPVRFSECEKIIDSLKNSKTSTDELPVKIFQSNSHLISPTISKLINRCFSSTTFPSCLKIAII